MPLTVTMTDVSAASANQAVAVTIAANCRYAAIRARTAVDLRLAASGTAGQNITANYRTIPAGQTWEFVRVNQRDEPAADLTMYVACSSASITLEVERHLVT